jgi:hypothetical protein
MNMPTINQKINARAAAAAWSMESVFSGNYQRLYEKALMEQPKQRYILLATGFANCKSCWY